ncbi:MAG: hypothetical protein NDI82_05185 [Anaeromyxobacteraceae bacterium]|nr:hypothetical protein [Anaeromyxobacteraceae bacterium]
MHALLRLAVAVLTLAAPLLAPAGERILVVRTTEDARFPARADVCDAAPFQPVNVRLGASTWSIRTSPRDGALVDDDVRFLGTATGCGRLATTSPLVAQPFLIHFDLRDGGYTAVGSCTITSNDVPVAGLLLLTCALEIVEGPPGVVGGSATSASVFNPFGLPGFDTGSIWALRIHDAP